MPRVIVHHNQITYVHHVEIGWDELLKDLEMLVHKHGGGEIRSKVLMLLYKRELSGSWSRRG